MTSKEQLTFIFIGRSGCGKGTQAGLLIKSLEQAGLVSGERPLFYLETGARFRQFIAQTSHSSRLAKVIMDRSERQPDFLAVWTWSHVLVENLLGDEQVIFDGTPRSLPEAKILDTALNFYSRGAAHIIYLDVSNDWSRERLLARGRTDDATGGDVDKRLAWFERDVAPAIAYYEKHSLHHFYHIRGEQTIAAVHGEIISALGVAALVATPVPVTPPVPAE